MIFTSKRDEFVIFDRYQALTEKYNIHVTVYPIYIEDTSLVCGFNYTYVNDSGKVEHVDYLYKSRRKAQLEAIHSTMYHLERELHKEEKKATE